MSAFWLRAAQLRSCLHRAPRQWPSCLSQQQDRWVKKAHTSQGERPTFLHSQHRKLSSAAYPVPVWCAGARGAYALGDGHSIPRGHTVLCRAASTAEGEPKGSVSGAASRHCCAPVH